MIGSDRAIARAHTRFASVDKSRSAVWTNERPRHAFRLGSERGRQWTKERDARANTPFGSVDKSRSAVWTNERPRHAFRLGSERGRQWTKERDARANTPFASVDKSRSAVWTNERPRHAFRLGSEIGRQWTKSVMRERTQEGLSRAGSALASLAPSDACDASAST